MPNVRVDWPDAAAVALSMLLCALSTCRQTLFVHCLCWLSVSGQTGLHMA